MSRLEKKCLIASAGTHLLLLLLLVLGSAFFVPRQQPRELPRINVVPGRLVDDLLAGGGGNPKAKPSEGQQKGETLDRQPQQTQPPQPKPKAAEPVKRPEPAPPKPTERPTPKQKPSKPAPPPKETTKPAEAANLPAWLKPVKRTATDRDKAAAEAAARERAANAAANQRALAGLRRDLRNVREGFASGTALEAWGPGGEAYANYDAYVKAVYDNAWIITDELTDELSTTKVRVTIAHTGEVLSAVIDKPSGNPALDRSVQRVLNAVKFIRAFPEGAREKQRTYIINFNLKAKRSLG
jgi:TonB family protein